MVCHLVSYYILTFDHRGRLKGSPSYSWGPRFYHPSVYLVFCSCFSPVPSGKWQVRSLCQTDYDCFLRYPYQFIIQRHTTQSKSVVKLAWLESITKTVLTRPHFVASLAFLPLLITDSSWTTILETWRAHEANFFRLSPCLTETTLSSQVSILLDPLVTQSWFIDVRYKRRIWHGYKLGEC